MMNKQKQKEIQEEIKSDAVREYSNEVEDEYFENWKTDNYQYLKDDFIEDRFDEFNDFCREVFRNE